MRSMTKRAEVNILLDVFPGILQRIKNDLTETLKTKKLEVIVKVYAEVMIPGARIVMDSRGSHVLNDYPGEWVKMVIDSREHILGFLSKGCDAIHQAVWSASNFLSLLNHQGILSEILLDEVKKWSRGNKTEAIDAILEDYSREKKYDSPGYQDLINRFGENKETNFNEKK